MCQAQGVYEKGGALQIDTYDGVFCNSCFY